MRYFIIVGSNNFWCSNISVQFDKDVDKTLLKEIERLKKELDKDNLPDEFLVYETKSNKSYAHIYN